jgi:phosphoribosylaminoimidazole carboxylase (NCAIR synthetase)
MSPKIFIVPISTTSFMVITDSSLCIHNQSQDKYRQKRHFSKCGIPLPDFMEVMHKLLTCWIVLYFLSVST